MKPLTLHSQALQSPIVRTIILSISTLVVSFALTSVTFARSVDPTPVVASVSGFEEGVERATLLGDGRLVIYKVNDGVQTVHLPATTSRRLLSLATGLGSAKLMKEHRDTVCMTLVAVVPALDNLEVSGQSIETGEFGGDLNLVLTDDFCTVKEVVKPRFLTDRQRAFQLRTALAVLATALVK